MNVGRSSSSATKRMKENCVNNLKGKMINAILKNSHSRESEG